MQMTYEKDLHALSLESIIVKQGKIVIKVNGIEKRLCSFCSKEKHVKDNYKIVDKNCC